jgi:hypothetical protein
MTCLRTAVHDNATMQEQHLPLARVLLASHNELTAIWTASGNIEYYIKSERGVTMRITPLDAHALAAMATCGVRWG